MKVSVYQHVESEVLNEEFMRRLEEKWSALAGELVELGGGVIAGLEAVEMSLVDDPTITQVHGDFMNDPTPTDVITFQHGEILLSVETAQRQAKEFGTQAQWEVALYGVHGLLHLSGYDDQTAEDFEKMRVRQEELASALFPELRLES